MKPKAKKINKQVAKNLRQIRRDAGYRSASGFANAHDIPVQTYLNHEIARRGLSIPTLIYYSDLLGVDCSELLKGCKL